MKKFLFSVMVAIVAVACQKGLSETEASDKSFSASIEACDATKTFIDNSLQVKWSKDDYINIWEHKRVSDKYTITALSVGKNYADLELVQAGSASGFTAKLSANIGYYPYAANIACNADDNGFKFENIILPASQTYVANSFGNGAAPMVAVSSSENDYDLSFHNICGVLRITLKGSTVVNSISVTGNNNEVLCGEAVVFASNTTKPTISMIGDGKTVTLNCPGGVQLSSQSTFDIVLPPIVFEKGFTIKVNDRIYIETNKPQTIHRSKILRMAEKAIISNDYLKFKAEGTTRISLNKIGSPNTISLNYCKLPDQEWKSYSIGEEIVINAGEELGFVANGENASFSKNISNYYMFAITGNNAVTVSGNIMSLLDSSCEKNVCPNACFNHLFYNCESIRSMPELPATEMGGYCYAYMFSNCTGITEAPELPAASLGKYCYQHMFDGCTGLSSAPELSAMALEDYCYQYMFKGCTGMTSAPELPATELAVHCYESMFAGCTGLNASPTLPATSLADYSYSQMFRGCSKLCNVKMLATDVTSQCCMLSWMEGVASYGKFERNPEAMWNIRGASGIPSGWTVEPGFDNHYLRFKSTGSTIIALNKVGEPYEVSISYCKESVGIWTAYSFNNSDGLKIELRDGEVIHFKAGHGTNAAFSKDERNYYRFSISGDGTIRAYGSVMSLLDETCKTTTCQSYCFYGLFNKCPSLISAPELSATTLNTSCYERMFYNCFGLTAAPALPAKTIAENCYKSMFYGCTGMIYATTELPATSLARGCYANMFESCTSITTSPILPATTLVEDCYSFMFNGCNKLNRITMLATDVSASGCINRWTNGVATSGIFYKNPEAKWDIRGTSGIPEGWKVENASQ